MANWTCGAKRTLPLDQSKSWDGGAAQQRLWDHFGWKGNTAPGKDGGATKTAFLLYDSSAPDKKGSYSLPFADVIGGTLYALRSGLNAAASRLPQKDGVSDEAQAAARSVIDAYQKKYKDAKRDDLDGDLILATTIRITSKGMTTEALKAKAHGAALDESVFAEADPFIWEAEASNSSIDAYSTRMRPSTLQNYAKDATDGVSYLVGHNTMMAPLGRTLMGVYTGPQGNGMARTDIASFTVPGLQSEGMTSDSLIHGIRSGIYSDVSVGFRRTPDSKMICSVCGGNMLDWMRAEEPCFHMPGMKYPVLDSKGKKTGEMQIAIADMENFGLRELSTVYKGATNGAQVKAIRMAEAGLLSPEMALWAEETYRMDLPGNPVSPRWAGWRAQAGYLAPSADDEGERDETNEEDRVVADTDETVARSEYDAVVGQRDAAQATIRALETAITTAGIPQEERSLDQLVRFLLEDRTRLLVCEKDATEFRADTVEQALAAGIRAKGTRFNKDEWRARLSKPTHDLADIRAFRDEWEADAKDRFKSGRLTTEADEAKEHPPEPLQLPARAYRA